MPTLFLGGIMPDSLQLKLCEIAERVAGSYGLEVVEVDLRGGGKGRVLRVFLDKDEQGGAAGGLESGAHQPGSGVTHEDCVNFSREFGTILDVEDAVPGAQYTLEVSSPGLDRKLSRRRDFERFTGRKARVVTREANNGRRSFEGRLAGLEGERLKIDLTPPVTTARGKKQKVKDPAAAELVVEIGLDNIERANLVPEF
jgi:ribosome maturation factor RimP